MAMSTLLHQVETISARLVAGAETEAGGESGSTKYRHDQHHLLLNRVVRSTWVNCPHLGG